VTAGWFIAQPMASIAMWHTFKKLRPGADTPTINPPPLPPPARPAFLPERPRGLAMAPGQVAVPLLSVGF
jgi:hypothetical protein